MVVFHEQGLEGKRRLLATQRVVPRRAGVGPWRLLRALGAALRRLVRGPQAGLDAGERFR